MWGENDNPLRKWSLMAKDLWKFCVEFVEKLNQKDRELTSLICKNLWARIYFFIFDSNFNSPSCILKAAYSQLEYFQIALSPKLN